MKRILILLMVAAVLLLSCKDESSYINYTWDDSTVDADSDGIPDIAEVDGTSFFGYPLFEYGARPGIPDLFVHVALMNPTTTDAGMMLQEKALDRVVARFLENGIALHFDVGNTGLYKEYTEVGTRGVTRYNLSNRSHIFAYNKSIFLAENVLDGSPTGYVFVDEIKAAKMPNNKDEIFYFMVMGSSQQSDGGNGSSGVAWNRPGEGGNEFLITLANWGLGFGTNSTLGLSQENFENYVVNKQASTIMHEFGHNLGLNHGGNETLNYKPNYYSIMNYLYQLSGLPRIGTNEWDRYYYERFYKSSGDMKWADLMVKSYPANYYDETDPDYGYGELTLLPIDFIDGPFSSTYNMDYSYGAGGSLNENSLDESLGLRQSASGDVNWNGDVDLNGDEIIDSSVSENINPSNDTVLGTHNDYNDWANLIFYYDATAPSGRSLNYLEKVIFVEEERNITSIPFERSH
ncbi:MULTISPECIES: hypothetical protein [unclassified Oceanispirochaeta]|uniref:hypothetical protein n=1 Tax=unclassified Oceanispirochaeta TaxID=2635722 RepID=UPI000E098661|nr:MULTISPECIES: hypothetical protein [unclassified Oceanispirochaeta]MBF9014788.1 hypothetical protein [Oceanispirochaeta sp. M2]NPD71044.1 hypothetical protein [Oceanispirochaeta sp. M1]RDG33877.1 hypothetical protein DV872_02930 [Oceanispirochaeta sp. M1]